MNKKSQLIFFSLCTLQLLFIQACKEIGPPINLNPVDESLIDTSYVLGSAEIPGPQSKVVLMEDFTGQECPNCPAAHEIIYGLEELYPNQMVIIAYYNYFADILEDLPFVCEDAIDVGENFSATSTWPAGLVDRKDFDGDADLLLTKEEYSTAVATQISLTPSCNVTVEKNFDSASRELKASVKIIFTESVSGQLNLTVALLEDSIVAKQIETTAGEIPDYVHNNVLRKIVTFYLGDGLNEENLTGRVYEKEYLYTIPEEWNADQIEVAAFVHFGETDKDEVLQAGSTH